MKFKRTLYLVALVAILGLSYSLSRQVYTSLQAGSRLDSEAEGLVALQQENSALKKQLAQTNSPSFVEQEARDKLDMARPGETVVIIPQEEIDKVLGLSQDKPVEKVPNWQGWARLFFK